MKKNTIAPSQKLLEIDPAQRLDLIEKEDARDSLRSVIDYEGVRAW